MRRLAFVFALCAALVLAAGTVWAEGVLLTPEQEQEALTIERMMRCPVCTGQSVAESHAEEAIKIKDNIRKMIKEGKTRQQILDYYASRYGDWIINEPPARGAGLVAWVWPAVVLVAGGLIINTFLRRSVGRPAAAAAGAGEATKQPAGRDEAESTVYERLKDFI